VTLVHCHAKLTCLADKAISYTKIVYLPPVLSHKSLQIFISAARATTDIRILFVTHAFRVSWIFPGSHVVNEPKMMRISREECVGR